MYDRSWPRHILFESVTKVPLCDRNVTRVALNRITLRLRRTCMENTSAKKTSKCQFANDECAWFRVISIDRA